MPGASEFLRARLALLTRSGTVVIVNAAMLVLPAAGLYAGIGVICGTGRGSSIRGSVTSLRCGCG